MHALELQLCTNVLSSCFVHEMHEMSNHNSAQEIVSIGAFETTVVSRTSEIGSIKKYRCALNYRPQTKFREVYVFTGVCLSTGGGWVGGYVFNDDHQVSVAGGYVHGWVCPGGLGEYVRSMGPEIPTPTCIET